MSSAPHTRPDSGSALPEALADLCGQVGACVDSATEALVQSDAERAETVADGTTTARSLAHRCTREAYAAFDAPGAGRESVRRNVAALQAVRDLVRMAALAEQLATVTVRAAPESALPEEVAGHISELGRITVLAAEAARAVLAGSAPGGGAGVPVRTSAVEELHRHLMTMLLGSGWRHGTESAVTVALVTRYYDRCAEHGRAVLDAAEVLVGLNSSDSSDPSDPPRPPG